MFGGTITRSNRYADGATDPLLASGFRLNRNLDACDEVATQTAHSLPLCPPGQASRAIKLMSINAVVDLNLMGSYVRDLRTV